MVTNPYKVFYFAMRTQTEEYLKGTRRVGCNLMRVLVLGHGHALSMPPRCLPVPEEEWTAFTDGAELILVDEEVHLRPDVVCDLSRPWRVPAQVELIVDTMGHIGSPLAQTAAFWASVRGALKEGGRMYLWRVRGRVGVYRKTTGRIVLETQIHHPKMDVQEANSQLSPRIPTMQFIVRIPKLCPPEQQSNLPSVWCTVKGDDAPLFSIQCVGELPPPPAGEYEWVVEGAHPDVASVCLVDGCDNGGFALRTTAMNGDYSFEQPKTVWDGEKSLSFYAHANSYVTLCITIPIHVRWWKASYTGGLEIALSEVSGGVRGCACTVS